MPLTNHAKANLEKLILDREAFAAKYRNTKSQDIPKAERLAENDRYIALVNSVPGMLARVEAENRSYQTEADRKLLYGVEPITSRAGWDGRRVA